MPTITEPENERKTRLAFDFPDDWLAFKYDEQAPPGFYRTRLALIERMRGVDVVAGRIPQDFPTVLLLEIKDYRSRAAKLRQKLASGKLQQQVLQKALHTWAGLQLGARQASSLLDADLRAALLRPATALDFVFFLAEDTIKPFAKTSDTRQALQNRRVKRQGVEKKLREKLTPLGIDCRLADINDLPRRCAWQVRALPAAT